MKDIFEDNKHTRLFYLENQFNALQLSNFSDASSYCTQFKSLKDQLAHINQLISEEKLVLRLVFTHINTDFDVVATMIQQTEPLPLLESTWSRLLLKELWRAEDPTSQNSSFVTQTPPAPSRATRIHHRNHITPVNVEAVAGHDSGRSGAIAQQ